jgi:hypothetical protein
MIMLALAVADLTEAGVARATWARSTERGGGVVEMYPEGIEPGIPAATATAAREVMPPTPRSRSRDDTGRDGRHADPRLA